jgi:hypothetical protein
MVKGDYDKGCPPRGQKRRRANGWGGLAGKAGALASVRRPGRRRRVQPTGASHWPPSAGAPDGGRSLAAPEAKHVHRARP